MRRARRSGGRLHVLCAAARGDVVAHDQSLAPTVSIGVAIGERAAIDRRVGADFDVVSHVDATELRVLTSCSTSTGTSHQATRKDRVRATAMVMR